MIVEGLQNLWRTVKKYLLIWKQFLYRLTNLEELKYLWRISKDYRMMLLLSLVAGIGGFQFGMDTGMFPGVLSSLSQDSELVNVSASLLDGIALAASLVAIIGAGISSLLADALGRKNAILIANALILLGYITMAVPPSLWAVFVGRILVGLGIGMVAVVCPIYVVEFVPADVRGPLTSLNGLCINLGQTFAFLISLGLLKAPGWRWMLGVSSVPAAIQFGWMWQLRETPRWLISKGKPNQALAVLKEYLSENKAAKEFDEMENSLKTNVSHSDESSNNNILKNLVITFKKPVFRKGLMASIIVHLCHMIGVRTVAYYGILIDSSQDPLPTGVLSLIFGLICSVSVDRIGRKNVMKFSLISLALIFHLLSLISYLSEVPDVQEEALFRNSSCSVPHSNWNCLDCLKAQCAFCSSAENQLLPGACVENNKINQLICIQNHLKWNEKSCPSEWSFYSRILLNLYETVYSAGLATVSTIINTEVFPVQHLAVGSGLGYMSGCAFNILAGLMFLPMARNQDSGGMYLANAVCSWVVLAAVRYLVPETAKVALGQAIL